MSKIHNQLLKLIKIKAKDDATKRKGLILNILLIFSITAFIILNIIRFIDLISRANDKGISIFYTLAILLFFCFLLYLSKKGETKTASWLLLITYSLPMFYSFFVWGTDLPAALLLAVLIIALSGILINANLVLISTIIINTVLISLTYAQNHKLLSVNRSWLTENYETSDAIALAAIFLIIAAVVWLFAIGIKKALEKAYQSEEALRKERDSLEIRVIERTKQLHKAEMEKINQLYHLAEFGRLSSGIFHDLLNPLTAVALNLEQIKDQEKMEITNAKSFIQQAILATKQMEGLIAGIKKQIQQESKATLFIVNREIEQVIQILSYKARKSQIFINFEQKENINLYGDPVKFNQIISNLLANAIEASVEQQEKDGSTNKKVTIKLQTNKQEIIINIQDQGTGIETKNINKIFKPFFSTKKKKGCGFGLGLFSTKNIIEKQFGGQIKITSHLEKGSLFTVIIPLTTNK